MTASYESLLVERGDGWLLAQINRPQSLNALNNQVMDDLKAVVAEVEGDPELRCLIVTGSAKAFAAGADIGEMQSLGYADMVSQNLFTRNWDALGQCRKPTIAAVAGFALGGGCEIAMMCDIIIAADTARFGQPEITLAVAPGAGGTQRLPRAIGKAKAMDLILTGRMMNAEEAERAGLVSRVVPADTLLDEAKAVAAKIAALSPIAAMMNKEMVNAAFETPLAQGLKLERRLFHSLFAFEDQKEGMAAFVEKRKPAFKGR